MKLRSVYERYPERKEDIDELLEAIETTFREMMGDRTEIPQKFFEEIACWVYEDVDNDEPGTEWNDGTVRRNIRYFIEDLAWKIC